MSSENISLTVSQITTITYADILIYSHLWINLVDKPNEILQGIPAFDMDQMPSENLKMSVTFRKISSLENGKLSSTNFALNILMCIA